MTNSPLTLSDWAQIWFGVGVLSEGREKYPSTCVLEFVVNLGRCGALTLEVSEHLLNQMVEAVHEIDLDDPILKKHELVVPHVLRLLYAKAVNHHVMTVVEQARKSVRTNPNLN